MKKKMNKDSEDRFKWKIKKEEGAKSFEQFTERLKNNRCVICNQPIKEQQVGRCVYGSCGHRQYQGTLKKERIN